jgi:uridine phosphorylase
MQRHEFPILEHDPSPEALIEPSRVVRPRDIPACAVLCFFREVIDAVAEQHEATVPAMITSELGRWPVHEIDVDGRRLAFTHPGIGAPFAAGVLEELIALGCKRFVVCGGAGVLASHLTVGHLVVPTDAVRDEGTSYHYAAPSRTIAAHDDARRTVVATLERDGVPYVEGTTWTTDAFYRETPTRIARRRDEGCLVVEMEAAALFAVAAFRDVPLGYLLYGGDDLSSERWDPRRWQHRISVREQVFWLAAAACLALT